MKKVIIIGGGVSGLSTGCYAQLAGFGSEIHEMHRIPGGVCTSWRRGDYMFDHCLHWVLGSKQGSPIYPVFEELGVIPQITFRTPEIFRRIRIGQTVVNVFTDVNRFEQELVQKYPEDSRAIRRMTRLVRFYTGFRPPMDADFGHFSFIDIMKMTPYMPSFLKLTKTTIQDYLRMFRNRDLRDVLFQMFPVRDMPALMVIVPLAFFHNQEGGYPLGGSLSLARAIEKKYLELGGRIRCNSRVGRIIVRDGKATGVELESGERVASDIVISACDGHFTLYTMLEGKYTHPLIRRMYASPRLWAPLLCISLGVRRDLTGEPEINNVKLRPALNICGKEIEWLGYFVYSHDPSFAPRGKSVLELQVETDYEYWKTLYSDRQRYSEEKVKIKDLLVGQLEAVFPGISGQVEVFDVATPVTWERYTNNWRGSYEGWVPTTELFGKFLPKELQGLKDFYMTGQWTFPGGGVPMCMMQARRIIKYIRSRT